MLRCLSLQREGCCGGKALLPSAFSFCAPSFSPSQNKAVPPPSPACTPSLPRYGVHQFARIRVRRCGFELHPWPQRWWRSGAHSQRAHAHASLKSVRNGHAASYCHSPLAHAFVLALLLLLFLVRVRRPPPAVVGWVVFSMSVVLLLGGPSLARSFSRCHYASCFSFDLIPPAYYLSLYICVMLACISFPPSLPPRCQERPCGVCADVILPPCMCRDETPHLSA